MEHTPEENIPALYARAASGDIDTVFERLGEFDPDLPLGAQPFNPAELVAAGRAWWERNRPVIRSYVCCNTAIQKAAGKAGSYAAEAAFGILAAHFGGPLATYASVIFIREAIGDALDEAAMRHLKAWCGGDWRAVSKGDSPDTAPSVGTEKP